MEDIFKTDKATRVLMLYHQLLGGHTVDKFTYSLEHGVNERTFDRDIETVRSFLSDIYSQEQLLYDRDNHSYYLSGSRPTYIDRMDATILIKILLESELLRSDEMYGLVNVLLTSVIPHDAAAIKNYLWDDIISYCSSTRNAIMKFIGDLYGVIRMGNDIKLYVTNAENQTESLYVSPLKITCEMRQFCLIVAYDYNINKIMKISIDSIIRFKMLRTNFAEGLRRKYYEIEGDKNNGCKNSENTIRNEGWH